jgi:hypothetical protein
MTPTSNSAIRRCQQLKHEHDIFEKFPDGTSLWRDSVPGFKNTRVRLHELAHRSENQFYAINITTGKVLAFNSERDPHRVRESTIIERGSKS